MDEKTCRNCHYFRQHNTLDKRKIFQVYCGHCTFARAKRKRPDAKACENFIAGSPQADGLATKEYLSKELLEYLLRLELLPEIDEEG